ncbi:hypothetical protein BGW42_005267 [Actinomortierella wolfii]|nr:hypothetical protein BGW42_005267 [Actinomortierella wolfii]
MAAHVYQPLKEHPPWDDEQPPTPATTDPFYDGQRDRISHTDASRMLHTESRYDPDEDLKDDDGDNSLLSRSRSGPRRSTLSVGSRKHQEQQKKQESVAAWAAFFTAALLGISVHFTGHTVGPLKDVLKDNMGISNTQFSLLQSSLTLFPTIVPLIGGLLVERYGTGPSSIVFSSIVVLAQVVVVFGCWVRSVRIMIIGFCFFGIGAAPIYIIQETIWVRYFKDKSLALVLALGLTTGKLAGFSALAGAYPLSTLPPFGFITPFLVSLVIACIAWVMNILFLFMIKKPKEDADTVARITILLKAKRTTIGWREVWNPFMHQASSIIKHRYNLSDEVAAWEASITLAVPLIVYPFLGTFIDAVGKRAWLMLATALLLVGTHVLILIPYDIIPIPPSIPMLLFALSLAIGTLAIVTSMPILTRHVPTGLGLHRSIDNIGATLIGTLAGMMQDIEDVDSTDESNSNTSITQKIQNIFEDMYHRLFPSAEEKMAIQEREDVRILCMFLMVAVVGTVAAAVFVWGDSHWTDGEDGNTATGLVNAAYKRGKPQPSSLDDGDESGDPDDADEATSSNGRRRLSGSQGRRRKHVRGSHEMGPRPHQVLEAMTIEPIFDLEDEPDAEEVSMTEMTRPLTATATGGHPAGVSTSERIEPLDHLSFSSTQGRLSQENALEDTDDGHSDGSEENGDEGNIDDTGPMLSERRGDLEDLERRYSVRIDTGEHAVIDAAKKRQAHFWILFWTTLLITSWSVFGIGMMMR